MNILAIDTSTKDLNITLNLTGRISGLFLKDCQLTHSEILMKNLDALLKKENIKLLDFDFFACCIGPGSFTGIRIGVTTIRAFAQIFNKPVIAVNSCEMYAYNEYDKNHIISCVNAMQNKIYYAVYKNGEEIEKSSFIEISNFKQLYDKYNGSLIVSDIEIPGYKTKRPENLNIKLGELSAQKAGFAVNYAGLAPLYVRLSSAEENLK